MVIVGTAEGVAEGGILVQPRRSVSVRCQARHIPGFIEVDVTGLLIKQAIRVSQIETGENLEIIYDQDFTLATVKVTRAALAEEVEEGEEELEEGEEAEEEEEE